MTYPKKAAAPTDPAEQKKMPEKTFRAGSISASVWLNQAFGKDGKTPVEFRTLSIQRGYTDANNQWQNTTSMRVNDIPRLILVLGKAFEYLVCRGAAESDEE